MSIPKDTAIYIFVTKQIMYLNNITGNNKIVNYSLRWFFCCSILNWKIEFYHQAIDHLSSSKVIANAYSPSYAKNRSHRPWTSSYFTFMHRLLFTPLKLDTDFTFHIFLHLNNNFQFSRYFVGYQGERVILWKSIKNIQLNSQKVII